MASGSSNLIPMRGHRSAPHGNDDAPVPKRPRLALGNSVVAIEPQDHFSLLETSTPEERKKIERVASLYTGEIQTLRSELDRVRQQISMFQQLLKTQATEHTRNMETQIAASVKEKNDRLITLEHSEREAKDIAILTNAKCATLQQSLADTRRIIEGLNLKLVSTEQRIKISADNETATREINLAPFTLAAMVCLLAENLPTCSICDRRIAVVNPHHHVRINQKAKEPCKGRFHKSCLEEKMKTEEAKCSICNDKLNSVSKKWGWVGKKTVTPVRIYPDDTNGLMHANLAHIRERMGYELFDKLISENDFSKGLKKQYAKKP